MSIARLAAIVFLALSVPPLSAQSFDALDFLSLGVSAGAHTARLAASSLASGVYVVRMTAPGSVGVQRLTVVR